MKLTYINQKINGKLIGEDKIFKGIFTTLGDANEGDIAIRHKINGKGIEIAKQKKLSAIITLNPLDNAIETSKKLKFPIIIVNKIEEATAFALKWTINKFAPNSKKIVITGTNGKSTTTHMIYHILSNAGYNTFTNTDAESEFNTLIDPMVARMIVKYIRKLNHIPDTIINSQLSDKIEKEPDYLVIEVSEVQGWLGKLMKGHGFLMTNAINPDALVLTNVAMDHIGLVNSIDEVYDEIAGSLKAQNKGYLIINSEDKLLKSMTPLKKDNIGIFYHGKGCPNQESELKVESQGVIYKNELIIPMEELPFKTKHFLENTLSAISATITLNIPSEDIIKGVTSYKSLNRRFTTLNEKPLIIDDFAHNPDGIKLTIQSTAKISKNKLWIVCAIRGSRGININQLNAEALAQEYNKIPHNNKEIYLTSSIDVVDNLNTVTPEERNSFFNTMDHNQIKYKHFNNLKDALSTVYQQAKKEDTILLIGAQGMDPASILLNNILS